MKILALRLFNVKRFAARGVAIEGIGDGVNVLCAANEFGKSTSFEALHALFFQLHSSTAGDVKNLRPYSGGNPLIEADISTQQGVFRITKQFYGRGSARIIDLGNGRLIAQADEAENFIASLVRGGTAGPAGLLWVRQGMTGIEKRNRADEEGDTKIRTSLLQSVQGEVEAVTGGRRMSEIIAATEEELSQLVTRTGKAKAGEPYAAAIEERNRLEAEEQRLAAEVRLLRDALDKRAAAAKRLAELDRTEEREERRRNVEVAQVAFGTAKSQFETLRAAKVELELIRVQQDTAQRALETFKSAAEKAVTITVALNEVERKRLEAVTNRDMALDTAAKARAAFDAAEIEEQEALALLVRLDAMLKAREAHERLGELQQKLEGAEVVLKEIEQAEAEVVLLKMPEKAVTELENIDVEIAKFRAVAEAGRSSVGIAYEPHSPIVSLSGEPLREGKQRSYNGQAELTIPGIGILTLRSGQPVGGDRQLQQSQERRRVLLALMGVEDLAAARLKQVNEQYKKSDLREKKMHLSLLAPDGFAKLRAELATYRAVTNDMLEVKADPAQVRAAHEAAEAKRITAREAWRAVGPTQSGMEDAIVAASTQAAVLNAERVQMDAILGQPAMRVEREEQMAAQLADFNTRLAEQLTLVKGLQEEAVDLALVEATLNRMRSVAEAAMKETSQLREEIAGWTAEIRARSEDAVEEKWRESIDALAAMGIRVVGYNKEVAVLQRLRDALATARSQARETYLLPVMNELRPLLGLLFDDVSITFDEKTLLPDRIMRNGQEEDVERLSGGMREQLSVLTRLAFARLLAKNGGPAPVILDDALVYSDDDRIERMFDALHRQAREQQIIVFSCRQRAFQKLGGNALQMLDWTPAE